MRLDELQPTEGACSRKDTDVGDCAGGAMAKRRITKAKNSRIMPAAAKVGMNVRWEFRPDGTIVATTTGKPGEPDGDGNDDTKNEWNEVMENGAHKP